MCKICNATNMHKVIVFTDDEIYSYAARICHGEISEDNLDEALYFKSANEFIKAVEKGFGKKKSDLSRGSKEWELLANLIQSVYPFAAAKQYQCVREIENLPKENRVSEAVKIFRLYYIEYFSVEIDSIEYQGIAAKKWFDFTN
jgi:hypothetical protein